MLICRNLSLLQIFYHPKSLSLSRSVVNSQSLWVRHSTFIILLVHDACIRVHRQFIFLYMFRAYQVFGVIVGTSASINIHFK